MHGPDSTILLLDTDQQDQRLVADAIDSANVGIQVLCADNPDDVADIVARNPVDLFLTEIDFPERPELDIIEQLRSARPEVPVVVVTRQEDDQLAVSAMKRGVADYLLKSPSDLRRLPLAILRTVAHAREQYRHQSTVDSLRNTNTHLRMALQSSEIDFWQLDLDTGLVSFTRERRLDSNGLPEVPKSSSGTTLQDWATCIHPDDRPQLLTLIDDSLQHRVDHWEVEYRLRNGGDYRWYLCRARVLQDDPAPPGRLIGCQIDINARKHVDANRDRLDQAFHQSLDGIAIAGLDGIIQFANPAWARQHNCQLTEIIGHHLREFELPGGSILSSLALTDDPSSDLPDSVQVETWHRRHHAGRFPCWLAASVLRDASQSATGVMLILHDVTAVHQTKQQLRESNERLQLILDELRATQQQLIRQERLRALGVMASGIAHDFNNSLSVILGFSELLLNSPAKLRDAAQAERYLQLIHTAASGASGVVDRLRAFYRQQEEDNPAQAIDLAHVVDQAIDLTEPRWRHQAQAEDRAIAVRRDLPPLPQLEGNEGELREALINLIINAIDAMKAGGTVSIAATVDETAVHLSVSDTGAGMPPEVANQCLEPFFTTKGERGTGMGLWIVNGVARRHGGTVNIESELGEGTTVTIHLPLASGAKAVTQAEQHAVSVRPLNILAVDDEPAVLEILAEYLRLDRHTIFTAESGPAALALADEREFDLVITDRAMPDMSGDRLSEELKSRFPDLPCIMITGFGRMMADSGTVPPCIDAIVGKPIDLRELRQAIAALINREVAASGS